MRIRDGLEAQLVTTATGHAVGSLHLDSVQQVSALYRLGGGGGGGGGGDCVVLVTVSA